ncbi:hypothetical protein Ancab_010290 [Ancistrocladus abbreviatus]
MEGDERPTTSGRKVKYLPKAPRRRNERSARQRDEAAEQDAEAQQRLSRRFNESLQRQSRMVEKRSSAQVAFAAGPTSTSSMGENRRESSSRELPVSDSDRNSISTSSAVELGGTNESLEGDEHASETDTKEYREPWDYNTNYPVTLPLRRPHSGDPEMLDEAEFGEGGRDMEYDESTINAASELRLLGFEEGNEKTRLLFFQFPAMLPLVEQSTRAKGKEKDGSSASSTPQGKGKEKVGSSTSSRPAGKGKERVGSTTSSGLGLSTSSNEVGRSRQSRGLENLAAGHVGKLLVYKSGAVKLKIGEILFDVSPGSDCNRPQDVVVINTKEQHCSYVGPIEKGAVVTADIDFLSDSELKFDSK